MKEEIRVLEERLRLAQLSNNVIELDDLISDKLQFIFLDGSLVSKKDDLEAHRNKAVIFKTITFTEQSIECFEQIATVTVKAHIEAKVGEQNIQSVFRYGRTWAKSMGKWKVISGNVTQIN